MNFGQILEAMKQGKFVQRAGWNGKGMYLFLVGMFTLPVGCDPLPGEPDEGFELAPFIVMKTADNKLVPWLASQTDVLAEDWQIFEG